MGSSGCRERLERRDVLCGCEGKANVERRQRAVSHWHEWETPSQVRIREGLCSEEQRPGSSLEPQPQPLPVCKTGQGKDKQVLLRCYEHYPASIP